MTTKRAKRAKRAKGNRRVPMENLRRPAAGHETLERLKRWPLLRSRVMESDVMIWSGEHRAYWRAGGGYIESLVNGHGERAEVLSLDDALAKTRHCGPEKKIEFHSLF